MPQTTKQQKAAGRELRRRREGEVTRQEKGHETRPFGAATDYTVRTFAEFPKPWEQRQAAMRELAIRAAGHENSSKPTRAFAKASLADVRFFATATDEQIEMRNKRNRR